jgi:hypothetical protein
MGRETSRVITQVNVDYQAELEHDAVLHHLVQGLPGLPGHRACPQVSVELIKIATYIRVDVLTQENIIMRMIA